MKDQNSVTRQDMALIHHLLPYTTPEEIPFSFFRGNKKEAGIPAEFSPASRRERIDSNITRTVICGENGGLSLRAEATEYHDFPVTEWIFYLSNRGKENTPVLSDIRFGGILPGKKPQLVYSNGETSSDDGYAFFRKPVDHSLVFSPDNGVSCNNISPYMRLLSESGGINIAIGWPAKWEARFSPADGGVSFSAGQQQTHLYLKPGETIRTPRVTLMGFSGGESRGRNLWRRWYIKHILPREDGGPLSPKLCVHTYQIGGMPEFTGITEENQLKGIQTYLARGFKPDVWWIDAGWYACNGDWGHTGTWEPDPERLPHGLEPIGRLCEKNDMKMLLWFEPERVRPGTETEKNHPDWLLHCHDGNGNECIDRLLNLGIKECCDWLIETVDNVIKKNHVKIYRQDLNTNPLNFWLENEEPDRKGALENFHVQGFLRYWDALLERNPGLVIDACAGGGRRNDLDVMRRAVPLQYSDVGLGNHPVKQQQHRFHFEWLPYFRAHVTNWDNPDGSYGAEFHPVDEYAYQCAMAPAITSMINYDDPDEIFEIGVKAHKIWRQAAELMLSGDYYPLSECRHNAADYYAMQFYDPCRGRGFIQVVRNILAGDETYTVFPFCDENSNYHFTEPESGKTVTFSGKSLKNGFTVKIPKRSGILWFYTVL